LRSSVIMKAIVCALVIGLIVPSVAGAAIEGIQVSNNNNASVTISWTTDSGVDETGEVHYSQNGDLSNSTTVYDVRGQFFAGCTHYVEITGLTSETLYYFEVVSGSETDDNGGNYYTFATMKQPQNPPTPCTITGCVYEEDGTTLAVGPMVYLWVTHEGVASYPLSDLLGSPGDATPGCFAFDIKQARSTATDDLFPTIDPGDPMQVMVLDCGNYGAYADLIFDACFSNVGFLTLASDGDGDGIPDDQDNCPNHPNGPLLGTCTQGTIGMTCTSDDECDLPGEESFCSMNQEDTYPTQGNGIGDACDCEADFNCGGEVDADDIELFLADFGRFLFNNPCVNDNQCNGDFECDGDVDSEDVEKFLEDFGRFQFNNPCPACEVGDWCVY
jgi:hypothetical protein